MRRRGAGLWGPASECAWRVWGPRHPRKKADVAQLAEHVLGKDEVTGSIPVIGSRFDGRSGDAVAIWRGERLPAIQVWWGAVSPR